MTSLTRQLPFNSVFFTYSNVIHISAALDHAVFHRQRTRRSTIQEVEEEAAAAEEAVDVMAAQAAVDVRIIITHIRQNGIGIRAGIR